MRQYEMAELVYTGREGLPTEADIDLQGVFSINGEEVTVKGFYAGNMLYKIRFLPLHAGSYHYSVSGIFEDEGDLVIRPPAEGMDRRVQMELPDSKSYTIEAIDTWNMKSEVIAESVSGTCKLRIPERPWMAVLARAENKDK